MLRQNTELTRLTRKRYEFGLSRKDLLFGTDDVYLNRGHTLLQIRSYRSKLLSTGIHYIDFAFSNASSMVPTM